MKPSAFIARAASTVFEPISPITLFSAYIRYAIPFNTLLCIFPYVFLHVIFYLVSIHLVFIPLQRRGGD